MQTTSNFLSTSQAQRRQDFLNTNFGRTSLAPESQGRLSMRGSWDTSPPRRIVEGAHCHRNLPDSTVGPSRWRCGFLQRGTQGFGLDLNGNGRYDRGKDAVLVFDMNGDGKYSKSDVESTNRLMKAATGNFDFNGDGCVSMMEKLQGAVLRGRFNNMDRNRDGRLDRRELSAAGGKAWIDRSRGGGISCDEVHDVSRMPGQVSFTRRKLDFVDPFRGSQTTEKSNFYHPRPHCGMRDWKIPRRSDVRRPGEMGIFPGEMGGQFITVNPRRDSNPYRGLDPRIPRSHA